MQRPYLLAHYSLLITHYSLLITPTTVLWSTQLKSAVNQLRNDIKLYRVISNLVVSV